MNKTLTQCRRCGCLYVTWRQTKDGRWYLGQHVFDPINAAYAAKMQRVPHRCEQHTRHNEATERHQAEFYAREH